MKTLLSKGKRPLSSFPLVNEYFSKILRLQPPFLLVDKDSFAKILFYMGLRDIMRLRSCCKDLKKKVDMIILGKHKLFGGITRIRFPFPESILNQMKLLTEAFEIKECLIDVPKYIQMLTRSNKILEITSKLPNRASMSIDWDSNEFINKNKEKEIHQLKNIQYLTLNIQEDGDKSYNLTWIEYLFPSLISLEIKQPSTKGGFVLDEIRNLEFLSLPNTSHIVVNCKGDPFPKLLSCFIGYITPNFFKEESYLKQKIQKIPNFAFNYGHLLHPPQKELSLPKISYLSCFDQGCEIFIYRRNEISTSSYSYPSVKQMVVILDEPSEELFILNTYSKFPNLSHIKIQTELKVLNKKWVYILWCYCVLKKHKDIKISVFENNFVDFIVKSSFLDTVQLFDPTQIKVNVEDLDVPPLSMLFKYQISVFDSLIAHLDQKDIQTHLDSSKDLCHTKTLQMIWAPLHLYIHFTQNFNVITSSPKLFLISEEETNRCMNNFEIFLNGMNPDNEIFESNYDLHRACNIFYLQMVIQKFIKKNRWMSLSWEKVKISPFLKYFCYMTPHVISLRKDELGNYQIVAATNDFDFGVIIGGLVVEM